MCAKRASTVRKSRNRLPKVEEKPPRQRALAAIRHWKPDMEELAEALEREGLSIEEWLELAEQASFVDKAEAKIERLVRVIYLHACLKLARMALNDERPNRLDLEFLAKRFDPKYMPATLTHHQVQTLPDFEAMTPQDLIRFTQAKLPPHMMTLLTEGDPGGRVLEDTIVDRPEG